MPFCVPMTSERAGLLVGRYVRMGRQGAGPFSLGLGANCGQMLVADPLQGLGARLQSMPATRGSYGGRTLEVSGRSRVESSVVLQQAAGCAPHLPPLAPVLDG